MLPVKSYLTLVSLLFVTMISLDAQLDIWTDKSFYASGETIRVGLHCTECIDKEIIHLELKNRSGKIVGNGLIKHSEHLQTALLTIPLGLGSDYYEILAFTLWSPSASLKDYIRIVVPIYNAFLDPSITGTDKTDFLAHQSNATKVIELENRSNVSIDLRLEKLNRTDVKEIDVCIIPEAFEFSFIDPVKFRGDKPSNDSQVLFNPVYFGRMPSNEKNILTAMFTEKLAQFDWLYVDNDIFSVTLKELETESEVSFVSLSPEGNLNYFQPELFSPSVNFNIQPSFPLTFGVDARVKDYLSDLRKRWIIQELFPISIQESVSVPINQLPESDRVYIPKDYIQFTDTKEFISEVVSLLKIKENAGKFSMSVLLDNKAFAFNEPLMFLNGKLVSDASVLFDQNLSEIDRIEVYRKNDKLRKYFSALGRNGAVAFYTKNEISSTPTKHDRAVIKGFQRNASPVRHEISKDNSKPIISPLIYCEQLIHPGGENLRLSFQTTDDQGSYILRMTGFTSKGEKIVERYPVKITNKKS